MAGGLVFIDGEFVAPEEARMSIFDYGFTWGDCVYDVTSVWRGWFFKLDEHLARFERSCAGFRLTLPVLARRGQADPRRVRRPGRPRGRLCQGRGDARHDADHSRDIRLARTASPPTRSPSSGSGASRRAGRRPLHLCRSFERISSRAVDQRFKNYNRADLAQARLDAYDAGCDDAVLVGPDGALSEGFGWNILLVKDGTVATPD